jgi:hypothetical protein
LGGLLVEAERCDLEKALRLLGDVSLAVGYGACD